MAGCDPVPFLNAHHFTSLSPPVVEIECPVVLDIVQLQDMTTSFHMFLQPGDDGWKGYFNPGGAFEELIAELKNSRIEKINFGISAFGDRAIPGHGFNFNYNNIYPDQSYVNVLGLTDIHDPASDALFHKLSDSLPRFSGGDVPEDAYTALILALEGQDFAWTPPQPGVKNVRLVLPIMDSEPKLSDGHHQLMDCVDFHKAYAPKGNIMQKVGMPLRCHMEAHAIDTLDGNWYGWDRYRFTEGGPKRVADVLPNNVDNFPVADKNTQIKYYEGHYSGAWGPCLAYVREQLEPKNYPPVSGSNSYAACLKHIKNGTGKHAVKNTSQIRGKFLSTGIISTGQIPMDIIGRGWQTNESQFSDPLMMILEGYSLAHLFKDMLDDPKNKIQLITNPSQRKEGWVNVLCKDQSKVNDCLREWIVGGNESIAGNCNLGPSQWRRGGNTYKYSRSWGTSWSSGSDYNGFNPCAPVCQSAYNLNDPKSYDVLPAYARMYCVAWSEHVETSQTKVLVDAAGNSSNQFNDAELAVMNNLLKGPMGYVNNVDVLKTDPNFQYGGNGPFEYKSFDSQEELNEQVNNSDYATSQYLSEVTNRFFTNTDVSKSIIAPILVSNGGHSRGWYMALRGQCAATCIKMCFGLEQDPIKWNTAGCTNPALSDFMKSRSLYPCCVSTAFAINGDRKNTDDRETGFPTSKLHNRSRITPYWGMSYKTINKIIINIIKEKFPRCFEPSPITPTTTTTCTCPPKRLRN